MMNMVDSPATESPIELQQDHINNIELENTYPAEDVSSLCPVESTVTASSSSSSRVLLSSGSPPLPPHSADIDPSLSMSAVSTLSTLSAPCCRICQLTEKEAGAILRSTGCSCRSGLSICHQSCLSQWVDQRSSVTCELCHESFSDIQISINARRPNNSNSDIPDEQFQVDPSMVGRGGMLCSNDRRPWFSIIMFLLMFNSMATGSLLTQLEKEKEFWMNEIHLGHSQYEMTEQHEDDYEQCQQTFQGVFLFTNLMCLFTALIWLLCELFVWLPPYWQPASREQQQPVHVLYQPEAYVNGVPWDANH